MGKWSNLKGKLEPWKPEPEYQTRVEEYKKRFCNFPCIELVKAFKAKETEKDAYEKEMKEVNLEIEAFSQLIVDSLENSGFKSMELEDGTKVSLDEKVFIGVLRTAEGEAAYEKWTNSRNIKKLKKLYVQTRDAFVKEEVMKAMMEGDPVPKQFAAWVDLKYKTRAKLTSRNGE